MSRNLVMTFHKTQKQQIQNVQTIKGIVTVIHSTWQTLGWNLGENSEFVLNARKEMTNNENTLFYDKIPMLRRVRCMVILG